MRYETRKVVFAAGAEKIRCARPGRVPTDDDLARLVSSGVRGIDLDERTTGDSLEWLDGLSLDVLTIDSRRPVPRLPARTLERLRSLDVTSGASLREPVRSGDLLRLEHLAADEGHITGPMRDAAHLTTVHLSRVRTLSIALLCHLPRLRVARVEADRSVRDQVFDLRPACGLDALRELWVDDACLVSLEGVQALPALEELAVLPHGTVAGRSPLDLGPLAAARALRVIRLPGHGQPLRGDAADALAGLEKVVMDGVSRG